MHGHLKILEHKHNSGRLRPHEYTSYLPLALLIFITGVALLFFTFSPAAADHPPPQAGSVGLTGVMPGKPPTEAPVITTPTDGQHFRTSPVTVGGTCPANTLVEIYKNDIFAGSVACDSNNKFSIEVDLLFGKNILRAIAYDALNQAGPPSNTVTAYYDLALPPTDPLQALNLTGAQLLLNTNSVYRGSFPGQELNVPITILGGKPPYAVTVVWGDSTNKVIPRGDNQTFNAPHTYQKPGTFAITFKGVDSQQRSAFLTVAAIINGQPGVSATASNIKPSNKLLILWPLFAIAATLVTSFWLGEKREKKILGKALSAQTNLFSQPIKQTAENAPKSDTETPATPTAENPPNPPR